MEDFITKFLIEILVTSGGLACLVKFLFKYLKTKKTIKNKKFVNSILDIGKLYDILQEARIQLKCCRILVLKSTNGGGIPKLDCPIYSTIIHEVYSEECESIKPLWQNRLVDSYYCQLLCNLILKKKIEISSKELEGEIKNMYSLYNQNSSCIAAIKSLPTKFVYISFVFHEDRIEENQKAIIDATINKVRNLFNEQMGGIKE